MDIKALAAQLNTLTNEHADKMEAQFPATDPKSSPALRAAFTLGVLVSDLAQAYGLTVTKQFLQDNLEWNYAIEAAQEVAKVEGQWDELDAELAQLEAA